MKQSNKVFLIIALSFLVLGLLTLLVSFSIAGFSFIGYNVGVDYTPVDFSWTAQELSTVSTISFTDSSRDVRIVPSQDGTLRFHALNGNGFTYRASLSQDGILTLSSDKSVRSFLQQIQISFYLPDTTSVLEVPFDFAGAVQIKTASGDIAVIGNATMTSQAAWSLETASGDISVDSLVAQKNLKVLSTSGDIDLDRVTANAARINSTSGDIDADFLTLAQDCYAESASGDISLDHLNCAFLTCKTASGDVDLDRFDLLSASEISTGSGDISLGLQPNENRYRIDGTSHSGNKEISLKHGDIPVFLRSQSGNIHVEIEHD